MGENEKTFEDSLNELEELIGELENGEVSLEQGIEKYQKGMELVKYCDSELESAQKKIKKLVENEDGSTSEEDLA